MTDSESMSGCSCRVEAEGATVSRKPREPILAMRWRMQLFQLSRGQWRFDQVEAWKRFKVTDEWVIGGSDQ